MSWILTGFLGLLAAAWLVQMVQCLRGLRRVPLVRDVEPAAGDDLPKISILFAARDEAEKLPRALETFLAQDYPRLEVIAVDDRSTDGTGRILDEARRRDPRLQVIHVGELPDGWLGKTHALQKAFEISTGEWIVLTDADVRFAPDLLRRALALARRERWDHVTLPGQVEMVGFFEKLVVTFFLASFLVFYEVWKVSDERSRAYCGVGAFQMLRRSAHEAIGAHRRLAMEVVDDVKVGKLVKQSKLRSGVAFAEESVTVRWQVGARNVIRGTTKNFFAGANYSLLQVAAQLLALAAFHVVPFAALAFTSGVDRMLAGAAALMAVGMLAKAARTARLSPLYGLADPLGALILSYMVLRSAAVTLWQGGIRWRGTFYPLDRLRKGMV